MFRYLGFFLILGLLFLNNSKCLYAEYKNLAPTSILDKVSFMDELVFQMQLIFNLENKAEETDELSYFQECKDLTIEMMKKLTGYKQQFSEEDEEYWEIESYALMLQAVLKELEGRTVWKQAIVKVPHITIQTINLFREAIQFLQLEDSFRLRIPKSLVENFNCFIKNIRNILVEPLFLQAKRSWNKENFLELKENTRCLLVEWSKAEKDMDTNLFVLEILEFEKEVDAYIAIIEGNDEQAKNLFSQAEQIAERIIDISNATDPEGLAEKITNLVSSKKTCICYERMLEAKLLLNNTLTTGGSWLEVRNKYRDLKDEFRKIKIWFLQVNYPDKAEDMYREEEEAEALELISDAILFEEKIKPENFLIKSKDLLEKYEKAIVEMKKVISNWNDFDNHFRQKPLEDYMRILIKRKNALETRISQEEQARKQEQEERQSKEQEEQRIEQQKTKIRKELQALEKEVSNDKGKADRALVQAEKNNTMDAWQRVFDLCKEIAGKSERIIILCKTLDKADKIAKYEVWKTEYNAKLEHIKQRLLPLVLQDAEQKFNEAEDKYKELMAAERFDVNRYQALQKLVEQTIEKFKILVMLKGGVASPANRDNILLLEMFRQGAKKNFVLENLTSKSKREGLTLEEKYQIPEMFFLSSWVSIELQKVFKKNGEEEAVLELKEWNENNSKKIAREQLARLPAYVPNFLSVTIPYDKTKPREEVPVATGDFNAQDIQHIVGQGFSVRLVRNTDKFLEIDKANKIIYAHELLAGKNEAFIYFLIREFFREKFINVMDEEFLEEEYRIMQKYKEFFGHEGLIRLKTQMNQMQEAGALFKDVKFDCVIDFALADTLNDEVRLIETAA